MRLAGVGAWTHLGVFVPFVDPFVDPFAVPELLVAESLLSLPAFSSLSVVRVFFFALAAVSTADVARLRLPRMADAVDGGGELLRLRPLLVVDGGLEDCVCMPEMVVGGDDGGGRGDKRAEPKALVRDWS